LEKFVIEGGRPLSGTVPIVGAKNAALPILAATVLAQGPILIDNMPHLLDIQVMLDILRSLGVQASHTGTKALIDASNMHTAEITEERMKKMRSSIFLMGPLLARFGEATVYQPGGCAIGERRIDLHLNGLRAMGAVVSESGNKIECRAHKLRGAQINLDFPSVGATENLMMAAVTADGITTITNAAREPEITDLQIFLNRMGAKIMGAGTQTLTIEGVKRLQPCEHRIIPDRIVAGTLMIAAAATRGHITLEGVVPGNLTSLVYVLRRAGVQIGIERDIINIVAYNRPRAVERIVTSPYPSFPTDLQAQLMVLLSLADGGSIIKETVFEERFKHVRELSLMGADIRVDHNCAKIRGVPRLYGATVEATDLRAGAALVIAGLAAVGRTIVQQIHHIDRGYESIETLFTRLGGHMERTISIKQDRLASSM
jgi:UDP-N-acetylglucosamine 1-carboxyvinyltransferase